MPIWASGHSGLCNKTAFKKQKSRNCFYKSHKTTRTFCFSGHFLSSQGLFLTCLGESPSNPIRTGTRREWTSTFWPLLAWSLPSRSRGVWVPYCFIFFLSYPHLELLPWMNEALVGPAPDSRHAPTSLILMQAQVPCLLLQPARGPLAHPTRTQSLIVYNQVRWCFYIYSSVKNPLVLYREWPSPTSISSSL